MGAVVRCKILYYKAQNAYSVVRQVCRLPQAEEDIEQRFKNQGDD
jgi:hypothetical protein